MPRYMADGTIARCNEAVDREVQLQASAGTIAKPCGSEPKPTSRTRFEWDFWNSFSEKVPFKTGLCEGHYQYLVECLHCKLVSEGGR
jgi:hypothetical protein